MTSTLALGEHVAQLTHIVNLGWIVFLYILCISAQISCSACSSRLPFFLPWPVVSSEGGRHSNIYRRVTMFLHIPRTWALQDLIVRQAFLLSLLTVSTTIALSSSVEENQLCPHVSLYYWIFSIGGFCKNQGFVPFIFILNHTSDVANYHLRR